MSKWLQLRKKSEKRLRNECKIKKNKKKVKRTNNYNILHVCTWV